ncbi:MAG: cytidylate kinase-like family protein [Actinobacteria bacterium]|nr:cytidylate kinase-like family protein [Actinomycetota bacterium]
MAVVTVSRQYGAGGLRVSRVLAEALGYRLVDRELVELAARESGVDPEVARNLDERAPALVEKVGLALAAASPEFGLGQPPFVDDRALAEGVGRVIRSLASAGGYVILGRGGQAVLADRPDAVHIQLVGNLEDRARAVSGWHSVPIEEARELCRQGDAERAGYVERFHGVDLGDPLLYDAVLNTSRLGHDEAAEVALAVVRSRLDEKEVSPPP